MKQFVVSATFVLICFISVFSQNKPVCQKINFISPKYVADVGAPLTFGVSLPKEIKNSGLKYDWNISVGIIVSGQGSPVINVSLTSGDAGENITAAVEITGLPAGCENKFSETVKIAPIVSGDCFCDYFPKSVREEEAIIDNILITLQHQNNLIAVFYLFFEKNTSSRQVNKRIREIINHFPSRFFALKNRTIFVKGKGEPNSFRVPIYTKGYELIDCEDCEIIKNLDVFLKKNPKQNTRRNK